MQIKRELSHPRWTLPESWVRPTLNKIHLKNDPCFFTQDFKRSSITKHIYIYTCSMYPHSWPRSFYGFSTCALSAKWEHSWMTRGAIYPEEKPYPQGLRLEHLSFLTQKTMWKTLYIFFWDMISISCVIFSHLRYFVHIYVNLLYGIICRCFSHSNLEDLYTAYVVLLEEYLDCKVTHVD